MRCFIALPLPDDLTGILAGLGARAPVGRPVPRENLHLTLAFLDEISEEQAWELHAELEELRAAPVPLALTGLEVLGGAVPSALVATATGPEALHGQVLQAVRRAGLTLARRRFRPHVTLTRLKDRLPPEDEARLARFLSESAGPGVWQTARIDSFALYRSHLRPEGPVYEELAAYPLTG